MNTSNQLAKENALCAQVYLSSVFGETMDESLFDLTFGKAIYITGAKEPSGSDNVGNDTYKVTLTSDKLTAIYSITIIDTGTEFDAYSESNLVKLEFHTEDESRPYDAYYHHLNKFTVAVVGLVLENLDFESDYALYETGPMNTVASKRTFSVSFNSPVIHTMDYADIEEITSLAYKEAIDAHSNDLREGELNIDYNDSTIRGYWTVSTD